MVKEISWEKVQLGDILNVRHGKSQHQVVNSNGIYPIFGTGGLMGWADEFLYDKPSVLIGRKGTIDRPQYFDKPFWTIDTLFYTEINKNISAKYIYYLFGTIDWYSHNEASGVPSLNSKVIEKISILLPSLEEQKVIAKALTDTDNLIQSIEKLIDKKEKIKKGTMQELLTGKKRLDGFSGEWEIKALGDISECLDYLRIPLNGEQRLKMKGNIPYCGANGIVDYVNDYCVDDDVILMAEDGGYFDEYKSRPIAYRMVGKMWVNNHVHIIKANKDTSQPFLFYSLVHKNVLEYITGGTRAKLNKSSLLKIEISIPIDIKEQQSISQILSDMDQEIQALEEKLDKYKIIKQGMMQELLTGRIRLI